MNVGKALSLPLVEGNLVKVIIGAVLNLIPIVNFLCLGYFIEVMANAFREKHEMPAWENWGDKFVKGMVVLVISFVYMLIPAIILGIGGGIDSALSSDLSGASLLGLLCLPAVWFILPMALAHYAATGGFSRAFSLGTVFTYIGAAFGSYLGAYLFSIVLFIGLMLLNVIPVIGWLICIFGGFYAGCVLAFLFGEAYRKAVAAKSAGIEA
ncbi:MAG: DUF4013 domain-containing protein [Bacillota bacterium]|uniref:DUF4013 domain-containing protein n=1 Tax=Desulforudis sp. DRI-14 TaxID=3459793 RepID=UPI0034964CD3